jgi:hypothetical protein
VLLFAWRQQLHSVLLFTRRQQLGSVLLLTRQKLDCVLLFARQR